jgi:hypothetical protein|eukprot:g7738.t1
MSGGHTELHYGFFGLTALGAASSFKFTSVELMDPTQFTDQEWMEAFARFDNGGSGIMKVDDLGKLLKNLYHGPPPEDLEASFRAKLSTDATQVGREEFLAVVQAIKREVTTLREGQNLGAEYTSAAEFQERMRANKLLKALPTECFHEPMTTSMGLGWEKVDYEQILDGINPKLSCAETKYADAMVKAGVYY